jgi:predicted enzyme related to lactoylglutathione lyase
VSAGGARPALIEFPADDFERARRFWAGLLARPLRERLASEGAGAQTHGDVAATVVGVHERGAGPGDRVSLPYFEVADMGAALARVAELGGSVIHPGEKWAVCRDSEGSPFGLAARTSGAGDGA